MKKYKLGSKKSLALFTAAAVSASIVTPASASFSDVTSPYKEAVNYLVEKGITTGYSKTEFGITGQIKRVDMAIMLAKALELNTSTAPASGFTDVPDRGVGAVNALKAAGLVNGKTTKLFGSNQPMTRGEMALILARAYELNDTSSALTFTDVPDRYEAAVKALVKSKITNGQSATRFGTNTPIRRGEFAIFLYRAETLVKTPETPEIPETPEVPVLEVSKVTVVSKATVQVTFNKAVDSATASNFSIAGGTVTSASLNNDKTTATLQVSGLADAKNYTIAFNGLKSGGTAAVLASETFTTPAEAVKSWNLKASAASTSLIADGKTSTNITYQLVDAATGAVDTNADNVVVDVSTTSGFLASSRITLQNGTASVKLTSPLSNTDVTASVTAKIVTASGNYSALIGKTAGTVSVQFKKSTDQFTGEIPILKSASSTQADRLMLVFDRDITLGSLVQTNSKGELLYKYDDNGSIISDVVKSKMPSDIEAGYIYHLLYTNGLSVKQNATAKAIVGLKPVAGNSKALEVILEKDEKLTNNQAVDIEVSPKNVDGQTVKSSVRFYLTDAKKPEAISAQAIGQNQVKVNFSETIDGAAFKLDALYTDSTFDVELGEYNPATQEDNRHTALLTLNNTYNEGTSGAKAGYFTAGTHKVEVSAIKDMVDNTGVTKNLDFTVAGNATKPTATVKVESPEQFRVTFNTTVDIAEVKAALKLQKLNTSTNAYADDNSGMTYSITKVPDKNEYMVELLQDWTDVGVVYTANQYRLFIEAGSISNTTNGVKNADIALNLNYSGSPLKTADSKKPSLVSIERTDETNTFIITMDEPVKLKGFDNDDTGTFNNTVVEFTGKDADGNPKTVAGTIVNYVDDGSDKKFKVTANLQDLVNNQAYNTSWSVVVKDITDDVGNLTAATTAKTFTVAKQANNIDFKLMGALGEIDNGNDKVTLTFSEGVQHKGGANDATVAGIYTLNGAALPSGTTISVEDGDTNPLNGYEKVVILLPKDTLKVTSNVIVVKKGLVSNDGSVLIGENAGSFAGE
ncbi:S-layer homology domain-containing protein [Domibacillus sp. A3M-37]|uniref:S-layer homology domain-containing protein n=1 Tax=Domibacillus sp. A3M-37 TaxID=2962037 RepID=UPI0020B7469E|nr:S-layer homology domain-containing protein [Domibacillus sp. A3M-37]MCP3761428.1 S-layer homology domain-containing protein [Domibacillus sp. A3M-37]